LGEHQAALASAPSTFKLTKALTPEHSHLTPKAYGLKQRHQIKTDRLAKTDRPVSSSARALEAARASWKVIHALPEARPLKNMPAPHRSQPHVNKEKGDEDARRICEIWLCAEQGEGGHRSHV